jgi:hypothetical protein
MLSQLLAIMAHADSFRQSPQTLQTCFYSSNVCEMERVRKAEPPGKRGAMLDYPLVSPDPASALAAQPRTATELEWKHGVWENLLH